MGLQSRSIKIVVIVVVTLFVIGGLLGLLFGLLFYHQPYIALESWPRLEQDGPLIWFKTEEPSSWHPWVRRINEFLSEYEASVPTDLPYAPCSTHPYHEESQRSVQCEHAMKYWAPCNIDTLYGYITGTPCVFLRLSNIEQWTPHPYNMSAKLPVPPDMPQHLQKGLRHPSASLEDYIWVSCKGESPADDENIGTIHYVPESLPPGFPLRRLRTADCATGTSGEQNKDGGPLIAVQFANLTRGVIISVECRIWSRDVLYDGTSDIGRTRFELLVE